MSNLCAILISAIYFVPVQNKENADASLLKKTDNVITVALLKYQPVMGAILEILQQCNYLIIIINYLREMQYCIANI